MSDIIKVSEKHMSIEGMPYELKLVAEALDEFALKRGMDLPKTLGDLRFGIEAEYQAVNDLDQDDWDFTLEDKQHLGLDDEG